MRHDRDPQMYEQFAADWPSVGSLAGTAGSGTLVSECYVLTAAHVAVNLQPGMTLSLTPGDPLASDGEIAYTVPHDSYNSFLLTYDLALVRLREPVFGVEPAEIYTGTDESGKYCWIAGWGQGGNGIDGMDGHAGTKRAGQNIVAVDSIFPSKLTADFDTPTSPDALDWEYCLVHGDSGGGTFIYDGSEWKLAGVNSSFNNPLGVDGKYGTHMYMTRVSSFTDWINDEMNAAGDMTWSTQSGSFVEHSNWNEAIVPGHADTAIFDNGQSVSVTMPSEGNVENSRLQVLNGQVALDLNGRRYTLTSTSDPSIAIGGSTAGLSFTISNGELHGNDVLIDGFPCTVRVPTAGTLTADSIDNRSGHIRLTGGGITATDFVNAYAISGHGTINASINNSGSITADTDELTITGHVVCGGTMDTVAEGILKLEGGLEAPSGGSVELGAGSLYVRDNTSGISGGTVSIPFEAIGSGGQGQFTHTGGTNTMTSGLVVGETSAGTYQLNAGTVSARAESIGDSDTGTFIQTGGSNNVGTVLWLGFREGSSGAYDLINGSLSAETQYIGADGAGTFTQTGGTNTVTGSLYLGLWSGSEGTYQLGGSGQLSADAEYIGGYSAVGHFIQSGGINTTRFLSVGSSGNYELSGGTLEVTGSAEVAGTLDFAGGNASAKMKGFIDLGHASVTGTASSSFTLRPDSLAIFPTGFDPYSKFGSFTNNGVAHQLGSTLVVPAGQRVMGSGTIEDHVQCQGTIEGLIDLEDGLNLSGGGSVDIGELAVADTVSGITGSTSNLVASWQHIGYGSTGRFTQNGGTSTVDSLDVGCDSGSGTYELITGNLTSLWRESIGGAFGNGLFIQRGGNHTVVESLEIGWGGEAPGYGTYELHGGVLSAVEEHVSGLGATKFVQTGGLNSAGLLYVGTYYQLSGGTLSVTDSADVDGGTLDISNGVLLAKNLRVAYDWGYGSWGELNIVNPDVDITISELLHLGAGAVLTAVPGSTIHMTGSAFENESTDSDALPGLRNLTMIFEGGSEGIDAFEVAGIDLVAAVSGLEGNFALGTLQLGGVDIGQVELVDLFDNQPDWIGSEALYVENLVLGSGSYLDLNGLNLYYLNFTDLGGTINLSGGSFAQVPEPAALPLLALVGLAVLRRRRK